MTRTIHFTFLLLFAIGAVIVSAMAVRADVFSAEEEAKQTAAGKVVAGGVISGKTVSDRVFTKKTTADRLVQTVRFLSQENHPRTSSEKNKKRTIDYIVQSLEASGLTAKRNDFAIKQILSDTDFLSASESGTNPTVIELQCDTFSNIHALKKGKTDKRIVVGAHYDSLPETPGANDNASGVAVLLELARLLEESAQRSCAVNGDPMNGAKMNCDIEFVCYDLEEWGLLGSRFHARKLKDQHIDVRCMLCLDMVGNYSDKEHSQRYPAIGLGFLFGTKGDFLTMIGKPADARLMTDAQKAFQESVSLRMIPFPVPKGLELLLSRSDHGPFWAERYPALFFTDTADYRVGHYHQETDTWDTLDYDKLADAAMGLYAVLHAIDQPINEE